MACALSTQLAFDYGDIPAAESKALERHAETVLRIQERQRKTTAENVLRLGEELKAAQERLSNHGNGTFNRWCSQRCGITPQHARRIIDASESFGDKRLEQIVPNFDPSALYALSADTCPEEALDEAIKAAKKGVVVTHKRAKEIIAKHTLEGTASTFIADEGDSEEPDIFGELGEIEERAKSLKERYPRDVWPMIADRYRELAEEFTS